MSGSAIALATKGYICCKTGDITRITRYVIPFKLKLTRDIFKLNLKLATTIKLNTFLDDKKLNLLKLSNFKLNKKITNNLKLNLKKCEE